MSDSEPLDMTKPVGGFYHEGTGSETHGSVLLDLNHTSDLQFLVCNTEAILKLLQSPVTAVVG